MVTTPSVAKKIDYTLCKKLEIAAVIITLNWGNLVSFPGFVDLYLHIILLLIDVYYVNAQHHY